MAYCFGLQRIGMLPILRTIVKKPLNLLGLDLVRYNPHYSSGAYAYIASLNIKTVIDIGAHSGEFARMIKQVLSAAVVYSFEPLKDEFRLPEQTTQQLRACKAFNCALGDHNGSIEIHRSAYSQSSSILPMAVGEQLLDKTKAIIVEVSFSELYEGQPLFDRIFELLSRKHFKYMGNLYQLLNPIDSAPLQADALFVRT